MRKITIATLLFIGLSVCGGSVRERIDALMDPKIPRNDIGALRLQ